MRLTGLLAVLLFVLIVFFAAPAASYAQSANAATIRGEQNPPNPVVILPEKMQFDQSHPQPIERALVLMQPLMEHGGDLVLREPAENDDLCYSMRTYVVARDEKDSDTTHFVRQLKCTPARKFNFKTTDLRIEPAATKPSFK